MRTHTRLSTMMVAVAIAAFVVAPAALATPRDGRSPDTRDVARIAQQRLAATAEGRSPDTRDAAFIARQDLAALIDGRSPDTRDAARAAQQASSPTLLAASVDRRSPDTIDAALKAHRPVVTIIHVSGFQWRDFGIGAAATLTAMLIFGLSIKLLAARQDRKQPSPVATA